MRTSRGTWLFLAGVLPLFQGTKPLRKTELVQLLAAGALSKPAIAALVRRNCLTFQPSPRDLAELKSVGADAAILAAIDQCVRARAARAAAPRPSTPAPARPSAPAPAAAPAPPAQPPQPPQPPKPPAPSEPLTQFTPPAGLHAAVGSGLPLVLEVRDSAARPVAGQRVMFAATSAGVVTPNAAETDSTGAVRVRVTLGEHPGPVVITGTVGTFSRTLTVQADPGPAQTLVVERDGVPIVGTVRVRSRDTLALRVAARDRYGNRAALDNFRATTTGSAIGLVSAAARDSEGIVMLAPRRSGVGEAQLSASGLRARVPIDVLLPAAAAGPWAIGVRAASLSANNPWIALPNVTGVSGVDVAVFGRRTFARGFSVVIGAEEGSLSADRTTGGGGSVSLLLFEGYGRAELAVLPRGRVSPVVALGAGGYRLKSQDGGATVYHTNLFWSAGLGADGVVSPRVTVEVRFERQWMTDTDQGHVATLWPLGAGLRIAF